MTEIIQASSEEEVLNNVEYLNWIQSQLLVDAQEAKHDPIKFFEFVMVEEHTGELIKVAPHQRVGIDFIISHDRSVNMWPVGFAKSFTVAGLALFKLGQDPTSRGAIVSSTEAQAMKPLKMVRQYIETSSRLRQVFPELRPSSYEGDQWTQSAITIERPLTGIRDASVTALGIGGALDGARLNWVIIDDVLNMENTSTKEQRDKVDEWIQSTVISRLDPKGTWIVIVNTAWNDDDLLHRLKDRGWPTLRMEIDGDIEIHTPPSIKYDGTLIEDTWGIDDTIAKEIRPSDNKPNTQTVRLTSHDPDPLNRVPLWPERFPPEVIAKLKTNFLPHRFNQLFRNRTTDNDTARCKREYIEACKAKAREMGHFSLMANCNDGFPSFTGVDLAISPGEENDDCAIFTFDILPGGWRRILDMEIGQWSGPDMIEKLFDKQQRYNSIVRVENNGAQEFLLQFIRQKDISFPLRAHTTGRVKAHPEHGVEGLFVEMSNGAWLIPNNRHGEVIPVIQKFIDACTYYSPTKHTPDILMACYFAREQARLFGIDLPNTNDSINPQQAFSAMDFTLGFMER